MAPEGVSRKMLGWCLGNRLYFLSPYCVSPTENFTGALATALQVVMFCPFY